jgi:short-subunit dehydrogenase
MIKNKTILLTGASGGIGREVAKLLSNQGSMLILVGRKQSELASLNSELGGQHHLIEADISLADDRKRIIDCCESYDNKPDIVINNAGIGQFSLFEDIEHDELANIINVNVTSTLLLTQALLPLLLTRPHAQLINIGSILGSIGYPGSTVYCASKFAIRGFSEALRRELLDTSISVRYFAPRATKTAINNPDVVAMNNELGTAMDSAQSVASQLITFLNNDQPNAYLGWPEKLFVRVNSLLPAIVEKSIHKQLAIIKRYLKGN